MLCSKVTTLFVILRTMDYSLRSYLSPLLKVNLIEPYQPEGIQWMYEHETTIISCNDEHLPLGGLVADEVGLGKTLLAVSTILLNPKPNTLVILPKSLVFQWEEQINKFTDHIVVHVVTRGQDIIEIDKNSNKLNVYLFSQSLLNKKNSTVGDSNAHNIPWDRIFIDEAHVLRNKKSKFYDSCSMLQSEIKWALTATPVMNRMSDFVNIMEWVGVSRHICQTEKDFITSTFILRRTKEDVNTSNIKNMKCNVQVKKIPFVTTEEAVMYAKVFHEERNMIKKKNQKMNVPDLLEHLLRVRQLCIHPQLYLDGMSKKKQSNFGNWDTVVTKIQELKKCIKSQPIDDKCIIFCQFVQEIDKYEKALAQIGVSSVRLDGKMNMNERNESVIKFKTDDNIKAFIIQINTGGQGINLENANHIYIMSPNWNPAIEYQAIGRAYRTGQTKTVHVTKFCITSGTHDTPFIEENIIELQDRKKKIIAQLLNDPRIIHDGLEINTDMSVGLSALDIMKLFNLHK